MPTTTEISTYVTGLASATLAGTEEVYLATDKKTTTQAIADLNGNLITTIVNIGDWDMDTAGSITVAHGLTASKIRDVSVLIINDASTDFRALDSCDSSGVGNGITSFDSTDVVLIRVAGGAFDGIDHNATSFNRGYITIQQIP